MTMSRSAGRLALPWRWFAVFGFVHGAHEWLEMFAISLNEPTAFGFLRIASLVISYLALLEFARSTDAGLGRWIFVPILASILLGGWLEGERGLEVITRYAVCLIGGLWSAALLLRQARYHRGTQRYVLTSAALTLGAYALASGGIVPQGSVVWFAQETFLHWFGVPIQVLRMTLATLLTVLLWFYGQYGLTPSVLKRRRNFYLGFSFVSLTLILTLGWKFTDTVGDRFLGYVQEDTQDIVAFLTEQFEGYRKSIRGLVITLANSPYLKEAVQQQNTDAINATLDRYLATEETLVVSLVDREGTVRYASNHSHFPHTLGQKVDAQAYFQKALAGQISTELSAGDQPRHAYLYAAAPMLDGSGKVITVAVIQQTLDAKTLALSRTPRAFAVNRNGFVLMSSDPNMPTHLWSNTDPSGAMLSHEPSNGEWVSVNGQKFVTLRSVFVADDWSIVILVDVLSIGLSRLFGIAIILVISMVFIFSTLLLQREMANALRLDELVLTRDLILNSVGDGIVGIDQTGSIQFINPAALRVLGCEAAELSGVNVRTMIHFQCWESGSGTAGCANCHPGGAGIKQDHWRESFCLDKHQRRIPIEYVCTMDSDHAKNAMIVLAFHDITDRKQAEGRLRLAASVFANTREGILITDATLSIVDVNPGFTLITGYDREEAIGKRPSLLHSGRHDAAFYAHMWESIRTTGTWQGELWNRRKSGETYPGMLSISAVTGKNGAVMHYVGVFSDITLIKARESDLERIAYYDPLTGVANRRLLVDRLGHALAHAQRHGESLGVCYLDLDGFKPVNDRFGHEAGDRLLIQVTKRLQTLLRSSDTLARLGGDEFALLLGTIKQDSDCYEIIERMLAAIEMPFLIQDQPVSVSASIGVTLYPRDNADASTLLRHADQAMYQAKELGKKRFFVYDSEYNQEVQSVRKRRERLSQALQHEEFMLYYQPKVHLVEGSVIGAEALIRWQHPDRGMLGPNEFLPLIIGSDLEAPMGEWVIETALRQMATWEADGMPIPVSVNVGANHLQRADFTERLKMLLDRHSEVSADHLELEILESSALNDLRQASRVLVACKDLGVHFSLDDFGTGYSSLSYFRELPVETLKIDQSFVRDMLDNSDDLNIVESVIHLARTLKRSVIAEGVESAAHAATLVQLGCFYGQGYAIARPMPADAMLAWLTRWQNSPKLWLSHPT